MERRNLPGNDTYTSYGFDTTGRVNATNHVRLNIDTTETVLDERSYVWDNAHNKTQRVGKIGGVAVKTYDYEYDALNRMWRSTKSLAAVPAGTPGSWTGDMTLSSASPGTTSLEGGETITLSGDFDAEYDAETLDVYVSKDQGTGAALPSRYRHDYRDRITQAVGMSDLDSGSGVPVGSEFSDDFTGGMDGAWVHDRPWKRGHTPTV